MTGLLHFTLGMGWKVLELFLDKNSKYWILNPKMYIAGIFDIKSGFMTKKVGFIANCGQWLIFEKLIYDEPQVLKLNTW